MAGKGKTGPAARDPLDRFMAMVEKSETCWVWIGSRLPAGYGRFSFDGRSMGLAHRFSYLEFVGPIKEGMEIDHVCRNPSCVRPDHLEAVSSSENKIRASPYRSKVQTSTHCANGHAWTVDTEYRNPDGSRNCRACRNEAQIRYRGRK